MQYTVIIEPIQAGFEGRYYARVPALGLVTDGVGVDGALAEAKDLVEGWLESLHSLGKPIPKDFSPVVRHIKVKSPPHALQTT